MIPPIIHYVWLGGKPLGDLGERCLRSWQKHLSGWEVRKWDETNSPMEHPYVKKMMERKLLAFASDYVRLHVLEAEGGVYLDTDMELIADIRPLLTQSCNLAFLSAQNRVTKNSAALGLIGCEPGHSWIREMKARYEGEKRAIMNTTLATQSLLRRGLAQLGKADADQDFWDLGDIRIYHADFFYPPIDRGRELQVKPRTVAIHHGTANWGGRADALPLGRRLLDWRIDRKVLRPIERWLKKLRS